MSLDLEPKPLAVFKPHPIPPQLPLACRSPQPGVGAAGLGRQHTALPTVFARIRVVPAELSGGGCSEAARELRFVPDLTHRIRKSLQTVRSWIVNTQASFCVRLEQGTPVELKHVGGFFTSACVAGFPIWCVVPRLALLTEKFQLVSPQLCGGNQAAGHLSHHSAACNQDFLAVRKLCVIGIRCL